MLSFNDHGAPDQVLGALKYVFNYNYDLGFVRATVRQALLVFMVHIIL